MVRVFYLSNAQAAKVVPALRVGTIRTCTWTNAPTR